MKKFIIPVLLLLNFIVAAFLIEVLFEDNWICEHGQWVNHGGILSRKPDQVCLGEEVGPEVKRLGGDRDEHGCKGSAGYTWCEDKNKCLRIWEEPCDLEEIFYLLTDLRQETDLDFSEISNFDMEWNVATDSGDKVYTPVTIKAKMINTVKVDKDSLDKVDEFLRRRGFTRDVYNITAGDIMSSTGYINENTACLVSDIYNDSDAQEQSAPIKMDSLDMKVMCGEF